MNTVPAIPEQAGQLHPLLEASLKTQWKRSRKRLKDCRKQFSEEAVHEFRVETRRLLSSVELLSAFVAEKKIRKARRALKKQLDAFDELRDTHVQLLRVGGWTPRLAGARLFHAHLLQREPACARQARKRVRRIRTSRLESLIRQFRNELRLRHKKGLTPHDWSAVLRAVGRAFAHVSVLSAAVDPSDTASIHRTRIAFKRFRYMVEALAPLLPGVNPARLERLHAYQSRMGHIQDAEVLLTCFENFVREESPADRVIRPVRAALSRNRTRLITLYLQRADELDEFWPLPGLSAAPAQHFSQRYTS